NFHEAVTNLASCRLEPSSMPALASRSRFRNAFSGLGVARVACVVWALAVCAGFSALLRYEGKPGQAAAAPTVWPPKVPVAFVQDRLNLVLVGHPQCPCTRASIAELDRIMARCQGRLKATVLFLQPSTEPDDWSKTELWRKTA